MPVPTHTVECTRVTLIAPDVYELTFRKPEGFAFKGGQFILFKVPLPGHPEDVQARAYSIASAPHEEELLFLIKLKAGGRMSRWIVEEAAVGATLPMQGPFGVFTLKGDPARDLLFVGTGSGVAPFRGQILEAVAAGDRRRMDVVFGVRKEEDLFWVEEMQKIARVGDNVFLHLALSQPGAAWTGHRGRVQTLVPLIAPDASERTVYVCGSPAMTTELKALCLQQWNVPKEHLHVEGYI